MSSGTSGRSGGQQGVGANSETNELQAKLARRRTLNNEQADKATGAGETNELEVKLARRRSLNNEPADKA